MKRILYSGLGLLLIAVAFLLFNGLSGALLSGARLDLTEQKLYTLSPGTRQILDSLDEPLTLRLFFSDQATGELPALRNQARRVEELLRTYVRAADGKLNLQLIDPEAFSEQEDQAAEAGLQAVPLNAGGEQVYFGLVASNARGDRQVIPFFALDREEFLEYEISRLINGLVQRELPVVGVLSGLPLNGGFDMLARQPTAPWMVMEEIRQLFRLERLDSATEEIPAHVSVLMLVHPKQLPQQTLYAIDQFVLRGGKLLAFVDPYSEADTGSGFPGEDIERASRLDPLLAAWGVRLLPDQVLADAGYGMSVGMGGGRAVRHPAWVSLPAEALDQDDVVSADLEVLNLASAGLLEPLAEATTRFTPLLRSSPLSMPVDAKRLGMLGNPEELLRDLRPDGQRKVLAARIDGPARSAYPDGIEGRQDGLKAAERIDLILVADTDLLSDHLWVQVQQFFGQRVPQPFADNAGFVINALDNLAGSPALISVRSRGRYQRPFEVVQALQRQAETRFLEQEQRLQQRLADTERQLAQLQRGADDELNAEQESAVRRFLDEKLRIRKELREVNYRLNADIEALGRTLKFVNIALVPLLLTLGALGLWFWRRRRA
ncbi:MAG TPA: Gldg family protein [Pseudomonas sp.]|uniref:GldG family protein n=1 Tax=Pseudomonas sp. TaxID=306 RepID=UPI002C803C35|nr:Gldg family protein [Pseudomonas sp.]HTO20763.1 Gldg family protein [Pseudomonas sp.]